MRKTSAVLLFVAAMLSASAVQAASSKGVLTLPIGGSFVDASGGAGKFDGSFALREFAVENNALVARGILIGTMTSSTGVVLGSVLRPVSLPVTASTAAATAAKSRIAAQSVQAATTCDILNLVLGPLSLNLLGLQVDLAQVVLDITAQTGAGNLLGNLLCAVTNLLNGVGSLIDIANLLNQILQILTGLL